MLVTRLFSSIKTGPTMFKNVCLGGTFDGIHAGHKLLFSEATKLCSERLVVGVTDTEMIKNKILWELIAPVDERITKVREYLTGANPNLTYHVVPIHDIYGPTIVERDLECIVVSQETVRGGRKINQARAEMGWPEMEIHVVKLIEEENIAPASDGIQRPHENKVSSSSRRIDMLGSIIRPPVPNSSISKHPYLIGLTGGIASGKTSIGKYLETLGFGYISYDLLGHKTYAVIGSPVYERILEYFGHLILNEENHIDRGKLGTIVFGDRNKLDKLNEIVWPALYALADEEILRLKDKHDIIVLESALLVESEQTKRVHQVWTCIIPPDEAIKRLMASRNLSEEQAKSRVSSQVDNQTRIKASNAIFCSLWEPEFTRLQVRKCVDELREKYIARRA